MNKQQWTNHISTIKRNTRIINNKNLLKKKNKNQIIKTIKDLIPNERFGILFSGGLDSSLISLICKKFTNNFICYTVGFKDGNMKVPDDIIASSKVAKRFGLKLKYKIYNLKELEVIVKKTNKILGKYNNIINIGVGSVEVAAIELAKKDKVNYFFSGLGSEEIFAGYERHTKAKNVNRECWQGLKHIWDRDLVRDFTLGKALKMTLKTPFLDSELIQTAMQIPGEWKINEVEKKIILREIAEEFLGEFAWRKKKAAQYGSCFDKAIGKLAKQHGFEFKKDYLESL